MNAVERQGGPLHEVASIYLVKKLTDSTILKTYRSEARTQKKPRGGNHSSKISPGQKEWVCDLVDADCTISLVQLSTRLKETHDVAVSLPTIHRLLRDFHYSLKKVGPIPERRNAQDIILQRRKLVVLLTF